MEQLSKQVKCGSWQDTLVLSNTVAERRYGLGLILQIKCKCGQVEKVETSKRHHPEGSTRVPPVFDIKRKAAIGEFFFQMFKIGLDIMTDLTLACQGLQEKKIVDFCNYYKHLKMNPEPHFKLFGCRFLSLSVFLIHVTILMHNSSLFYL